jgi:hypothetical protein
MVCLYPVCLYSWAYTCAYAAPIVFIGIDQRLKSMVPLGHASVHRWYGYLEQGVKACPAETKHGLSRYNMDFLCGCGGEVFRL